MSFGNLKLSVDEIARGLPSEIHLRPKLVPTFFVDLGKPLVETAHFVKKLSFGDSAISYTNRCAAATGAAGTTRAPVDKNQQHEYRHHAPKDKLEVTQVVSQPLESH